MAHARAVDGEPRVDVVERRQHRVARPPEFGVEATTALAALAALTALDVRAGADAQAPRLQAERVAMVRTLSC